MGADRAVAQHKKIAPESGQDGSAWRQRIGRPHKGLPFARTEPTRVSQKESNSELIHFDVAVGESVKLLFDHLIGAGEQAIWHVEAERLRSLEIDHELAFCWLLHRQIRRLLPLRIRST